MMTGLIVLALWVGLSLPIGVAVGMAMRQGLHGDARARMHAYSAPMLHRGRR